MNKNEQINKLIEEALNSVDDVKRAETKPYLFTRINARMNKGVESVWEKAGWFITRPVVALTGICLVVLINATAIFYNKTATQVTTTDVAVQNTADEFSYTVAGIYDSENTQP
jgi:hypothetical protein